MLATTNSFDLSNDPAKDCFTHNKVTYNISQKISSNVFLVDDPVDGQQKALKICKVPLRLKRSKMVKRFDREIVALKKAKEADLKRVIELFFDGTIIINNETYQFYVMEKADTNLRDFLERNCIDVDERYLLCRDILEGLKGLHSINVYHRDIKPENILLVDNYLKIADLGLIAYRKDDNPIDHKGDKIGPYGWLSPEVMNKVYTEKVSHEYAFDCLIDEQSDVFQLGKLFWYIFQGNIPIGQIIKDDFKRNIEKVFEIIFNMTQYSKDRRSFLNDVEAMLVPLAKEFNC